MKDGSHVDFKLYRNKSGDFALRALPSNRKVRGRARRRTDQRHTLYTPVPRAREASTAGLVGASAATGLGWLRPSRGYPRSAVKTLWDGYGSTRIIKI
ncbi:hypothetical protein EVAR_37037_1 [Eumeta japonica]|uniref:Uncharacterized protein n=1 Tax=Eumeta variegata TaxID=151549 RepID=A0A4C1WFU1_EUMVA|nr:hypothetical protein EVAR_37037_1 [Eumeta japonica]